MENILVTAIGAFSADIVIKNLKKYGFNIIGTDIYPKEWIVDSYNVSNFYKAPYATDKEEYINFILEVCKKENIKLILPLTDIEIDVINENRNILRKNGIKICISDENTIRICRNKKEIEVILRENNLCKTIPTQLLSKTDIEKIKYPVVCKPFNGRSSQGVNYIYNYRDLKSFISNNDISEYIIQPFINGNIVTVDVVRNQKERKTVVIARKELLRTLNGAGTSVYIYNDVNLENICVKIANILNINGCVNFEFIQDEQGNMYFMECNPRFSGGVEFSCIAGYDFIINHIRCFENQQIDGKIDVKNQYICRKYEEFVTCIK